MMEPSGPWNTFLGNLKTVPEVGAWRWHPGTTSVLLIQRPVLCTAIGSLSARFKVSLSMAACPRDIFDLPD